MRLGMTQGCHDSICQSGEESDHFSETTGRELKEILADSDLYKEQTQALKARYQKLCDYWQLPKDDAKRNGSLEFFSFFKKLFKQLEDAFPKVDRKRAGAKK